MAEFAKETDLCAAFIKALPKEWTAYPETGGFDILLVRAVDGFQIGVEAKLALNAKVICQAVEDGNWSLVADENPDCRAVLVPAMKHDNPLLKLCALLGVTVISPSSFDNWSGAWRFNPTLPDLRYSADYGWFELAPSKRITLPDFVPDVVAGDSAPVRLTAWKQKAIRIAVTLEKRGYLTRRDFKEYAIDMQRWRDGWLVLDENKNWIAGPRMPDFRAQHPVNFQQMFDAYDTWRHDREQAA